VEGLDEASPFNDADAVERGLVLLLRLDDMGAPLATSACAELEAAQGVAQAYLQDERQAVSQDAERLLIEARGLLRTRDVLLQRIRVMPWMRTCR
jgi:hypothetical protein